MTNPNTKPGAGKTAAVVGSVAMVMAMSGPGLERLEAWEGMKLSAYADPATKGDPWTICAGATGLIHYDGKVVKVVKGLTLTRAQCAQVTEYIVETYRAGLNRCVKRPLNQNQSNGLINFAVNVGVPGACSGSVVRHINAGDFEAAARVMLLYSCAPTQDIRYPRAHCGPTKRQMPGLLYRRQYEAGLMTAPVTPWSLSPAESMAKANAKSLKP